MGRLIEKTSLPFKDLEAYNTLKDQIQLKYDGEDVVFTGYLIEFHDLLFEKVKRSNFAKVSDFFYEIKEFNRINCFIPTKKNFLTNCFRFLTRKLLIEEFIEILIGFSKIK